MSCYGCKCNFCARNCELPSFYVTIGEIRVAEHICFTCDECRRYDGDYRKRNQWRSECEGFIEAKKYTETCIEARRRSIKVIEGRKNNVSEDYS